MGPPPFTRGVRGWISVSKKARLEGLYGGVSLQGLSAQWTITGWRDHNLWGIILRRDSTILDVATIILNQ